MKNDSLTYENPWRQNIEVNACIGWAVGALGALVCWFTSGLPSEPFLWMLAISVVMLCLRVPQAIKIYQLQKHLAGRPLEKMKLTTLCETLENKPGMIWLGKGFIWEQRHAQRIHEILKRDWSQIVKYGTDNAASERVGQTWIHGVEPKEETIFQSLTHSEGQNLILGTTGAGKTRMFDLLISQAILRGEAVMIIDPKGDRDLRDKARRACESIGRPEKFLMFHPAFPEESIRINPLKNFSNVSEIASRLAALIPSEAGADPFKSFGWQAINNIAQALVMADEKPSLTKLKRFLESGAQNLLVRAVIGYAARNIENGEERARDWLDKAKSSSASEYAKLSMEDRMAASMTAFYRKYVQPEKPSPELEALLSMYEHDRTHFSKMVANLLPIMNMLTSGYLKEMLSPDYDDDEHVITNMRDMIKKAQVCYVGLNSLTDQVSAGAIGSLLLSDLVSVAGDRYNFPDNNKPVNIFIDEAAEVINEPTIALLNKGRGSLMKVFVATQTIADLESRLGSKEKARMVLGNINNLYVLRIIDQETQEYVTETLPKTRIKSIMRDQGFSTNPDSPLAFSANTGERLMEEEGDLFSSQLLGMLPNLEYIAKISGGLIIKGRLPILE